jgi:hypothetical protein
MGRHLGSAIAVPKISMPQPHRPKVRDNRERLMQLLGLGRNPAVTVVP